MHTCFVDHFPNDSCMPRVSSEQSKRWLWPATLFAVTLFALGMRWYYVTTAIVINPERGDAIQYVNYARNLVEHHTFAKDLPDSKSIAPDNYRDPTYPVFLALLMNWLGTGTAWYAGVLICQSVLGALTVTLATLVGSFWLRRRWAIFAGLLMAVWPQSVAINSFLLSETLFSFFCVFGLFLCARAFRNNLVSYGFTAGLVFGTAALTNAVLLPFGLLLAGLFGWRRHTLRRVCLALAAGAMLLPGIWAVRNLQLKSSLTGESSRDRAIQNFVQGESLSYHPAWRDSIFGDSAKKANAAVLLHEIDKKYALLSSSPKSGINAIWLEVSERPARYAFWYLVQKPYELWGWAIMVGQGDIYVYPTVNSPFMKYRVWIALEAICVALNPLLLLLMIVGIIFGISPAIYTKVFPDAKNRSTLIAVICLLVFSTVIYTLLQAEPRYSIAFRPFEILLATTAIAGALNLRPARSDTEGCSRARI
jgi:hypothetical protein